jgi:hypothetical protein
MRFSKVLSLTLFLPAAMGCADTHLGKGCTTAFVIDDDCDGYGVGPGLLGPDVDDGDAT